MMSKKKKENFGPITAVNKGGWEVRIAATVG